MAAGRGEGEKVSPVEARIADVQRRKRRTVRWKMSRHTAERAIAAITDGRHYVVGKRKSRRRKRHKRLL